MNVMSAMQKAEMQLVHVHVDRHRNRLAIFCHNRYAISAHATNNSMECKISRSKVFSVCFSLHSPSPISDRALTIMLYSVPACSRHRIVEVAGGKPGTVTWLPKRFDPCLPYCTRYCEIVKSLWGAFQITLRHGAPFLIILIKETPLIFEGPVRER